MPKGRFLEQSGSRVVFANPEIRKQTLTSKLQLSQKDVSGAKVENVRSSIKVYHPSATIVIPNCEANCLPRTEILTVEISLSGSAYNKAMLRQMLTDAVKAIDSNFDGFLVGWNLTSASDVEFSAVQTADPLTA